MSDVRAAQAREAHRLAGETDCAATRHREIRNCLVRQLRAEDPARWTYAAMASAVRCSPELIAVIVRDDR